MKARKIVLPALVAVFLLSAALSAYAVMIIVPVATPSDTSHFGNMDTTVTPTGGNLVPNTGSDPGDMNNTFHDNSNGPQIFGSGF